MERHLLEGNISVSCQKGKSEKGPEGTTKVKCSNAFDVFGKIPGTPQYWKNYRNELFARMEQLGPFHFFFTLSAAEMRYGILFNVQWFTLFLFIFTTFIS